MKKRRNSKQRQDILDSVLENKNHPTADQIYLSLREKNSKISRGTVYRNLNLLTTTGDIQNIKTPYADRYDWRKDKHYHLLCTICNKLIDTSIPYNSSLDQSLASDTGYTVEGHQAIFEGLCPDCKK